MKPGRRDVAALMGGLILVAVPVWTWWKISSSADPVGFVAVSGGYFAPVAITLPALVALLAWWWKGRTSSQVSTPQQVVTAADRLAEGMLDTWRQEAKDRQISTPAPARVRWQWADVTTPPAELTTLPEPGAGPRPLPEGNPARPGVLLEAGVVTRLHNDLYSRLPHGNLVLIGEAGAGKTGAMILLLLAALDYRLGIPDTQRDEIPVPVWLTLGGWDPTTQTLRQWAVATMYRDHPYLRATDYGQDAAGELLRSGRIALFLDGLDEMATEARLRALKRIEHEGAGLRIVLSSRPGEYRQTITAGRLHNTAVIEVTPVHPREAHVYLLRGQTGLQRDRWDQVGDYIEHHPDRVAAHALATPLSLSLARATYEQQDPTVLTNPAAFTTVEDLRQHLIDRILMTAYPEERQRDHATRWLAWIARHMQSDRDLAWWHIPTWIHPWRLRLAAGLTVVLMAWLAVSLAAGLGNMFGGPGMRPYQQAGLTAGLSDWLFGLYVLGFTIWPPPGWLTSGLESGWLGALTAGLVLGIPFGLVVGIPFGFTVRLGREPRVIRPRWPRPREILRLAAFLLTGVLVVGLIIGIVVGATSRLGPFEQDAGWYGGWVPIGLGLTESLMYGLMFGFPAGLTSGLTVGLVNLWQAPLPRAATATPATTYRLARRTSIIIGLTVGLIVGPAVGIAAGFALTHNASLAFELTEGLTLTPGFGLTFSLAGGLAVGLVVGGVAFIGGSMPMVILTQLILVISGSGGVRFRRLLEDAHRRHILRQAGAVYQFRHAELQEHLTKLSSTRP
ncbi:MAG: hypothetical protein ACT4NY_14970 [Pseudonocardiales bacterium]